MEQQDNYTTNQQQYKPAKLTDEELLQIFPESRGIIPEKILEYQEERKGLINRMRAFNASVKNIAVAENKDNFFVWFWGYAYLKYFQAPFVVQIDRHLQRLYRQRRRFTKDENKNAQVKWEELKELAKSKLLYDIALPYLEKIRQIGNKISASCPFHDDKTPSFFIYLGTNTFHCFGCQARGDVITFKMKIDNLSFKDAVRGLAL